MTVLQSKTYNFVITDRQLEGRRNPITLKDLARIVSIQLAEIGLAGGVCIIALLAPHRATELRVFQKH